MVEGCIVVNKLIFNKIKNLLALIILIIGLGLILFPTISNCINSSRHHKTIIQYKENIKKIDDMEYNKILDDAREYNELLFNSNIKLDEYKSGKDLTYTKLLNINSTGIMGYIEIPKIKIVLPIYHGTSEEVLKKGVGHLEGSSLPVGGENTHSIISGHSGLPTSKLFTDITKLKIGDTFTIRVLNETLTYKIDQIETVKPNEFELLEIEKGKDYCTLVTCTPYGINTHRLLIRGHRIETSENENNAELIDKLEKENNFILITITVIISLLIISLLILKIFKRKRV